MCASEKYELITNNILVTYISVEGIEYSIGRERYASTSRPHITAPRPDFGLLPG